MFRATLYFSNSSNRYGWSETYTDLTGSYTGTLTRALQLATARLQMLTNDCAIDWVRVSDTTEFRDVIIDPTFTRTGTVGALDQPACSDFQALLLRVITANPKRWGYLFLRGFPAANVANDQYKNVDPFGSLLTAYGVFLANNGWGIAGVSRNKLVNRNDITNITTPNTRGYRIFTAVTPPTIGGLVYVGQVPRTLIGASGYKTVQKIVTNVSFDVGGAVPVGDFSGNPYWISSDLSVTKIAAITPLRITHRPAGRPFGQRVGRRPNRLPLRR